MDKVIRNGAVAVLYSPGFGAGWYTWNPDERLLFHPILVELVESGKQKDITKDFMEALIGQGSGYYGGSANLTIAWVPQGARFRVDEYDGSESVVVMSPDDGIIA